MSAGGLTPHRTGPWFKICLVLLQGMLHSEGLNTQAVHALRFLFASEAELSAAAVPTQEWVSQLFWQRQVPGRMTYFQTPKSAALEAKVSEV